MTQYYRIIIDEHVVIVRATATPTVEIATDDLLDSTVPLDILYDWPRDWLALDPDD